MRLLVRAARVEDIPSMHRIRLAVRENRLAVPDRITEGCYLRYVRDDNAWVAEAGGTMAGFAALDLEQASIWALFVDPAAEGAGVGRALHQCMLASAAERGLRRLSLSTAPATRAEHFYAAAGWTRDGITPSGEMRFVRDLAGVTERDVLPG